MAMDLFRFTYVFFFLVLPTRLLSGLTMWVTRLVSNKKKNCLHFGSIWFHLLFYGVIHVVHLLNFLYCVFFVCFVLFVFFFRFFWSFFCVFRLFILDCPSSFSNVYWPNLYKKRNIFFPFHSHISNHLYLESHLPKHFHWDYKLVILNRNAAYLNTYKYEVRCV